MRARLAGWRAVLVLVAGAVDAAVTARVGIPRIAWRVRQLAAAVRAAYRNGRHGTPSTCTEVDVIILEGEVIDE